MEYTLKLSHEDVIVIMGALAELPVKVGVVVFNKIDHQTAEQRESDDRKSSQHPSV